jgi:aminoglycoside phosphotransferase (APT) family kinase protein
MTPPWSAEIEVSVELARGLIETQFPRLAPVDASLAGVGWDNSAISVNGAYIFRFPRRQIAVACLEVEIRLLPAIAGKLPLPISAPTLVGSATGAYPWPFAGYPILGGRTVCAAGLSATDRARNAVTLARFLAALHAIPVDEAAALGASGDTLGRLDLAKRIPAARDLLRRLIEKAVVLDPNPIAAILDRASAQYEPRVNRLVHGDLYARHLLVDERNDLAGVIDWGDVHIGDRAVDLAVAHAFLPKHAHEAFWNAYGEIEDRTWEVARLRAVWHSLATLLYGSEVGDAELERESRLALQHITAPSV